MEEGVAKALEHLVGKRMSEGMSLALSEKMARIEAFENGIYAGERCSRCPRVQATLWTWGPVSPDFESEPRVTLCDVCHTAEAVYREGVRRVRLGAQGT